MTEQTDVQLAEDFRQSADAILRIDGDRDHMVQSNLKCEQTQAIAHALRLAARRLEARGEIGGALVESLAKAIYDLDPYYEDGEYLDGFPVSPGGYLTWARAKARDAEFEGVGGYLTITTSAYVSARAALEAALSGKEE